MKTVSALSAGTLLLLMDIFPAESANHSTILVRGEYEGWRCCGEG